MSARRFPRLSVAAALVSGVMSSMVSGYAAAQDDLGALSLADATPTAPVATTKPWKLNVEGGSETLERWDGTSSTRYRYSLDGVVNYALTPDVRAVVAARIERNAETPTSVYRTTPYLKEAYLSWQPSASQVIDAGRINQRFGVATGYNPTDFFKSGSVVTSSPDPVSRRTNRLGSVMLQGQQLWDSGSVSLLLSPRLATRREPGDPEADDALSKTNSTNRWLLTGSQQIGATLRPQWLIYREEGHSPQFGFNLSTLLGKSAVVYGEWAGGRAPSLFALANRQEDDVRFRSRSAVGVTYTWPLDITTTFEWQTNGAGVAKGDDQVLAFKNPATWGNALRWSYNLQDAVTRQAFFTYLSAHNVVVQGLDLSGFVQADMGNQGRQAWLELRKRYESFSLSLQWQRQRGEAWTRFGALPERNNVKVLADLYY
jgi:hypothetical protein